MGMCISLTAKPMKPMMKKPTATALETWRNSSKSAPRFESFGHKGKSTLFIRLGASIHERHAIFDKVAWDVEELFDLV
jgi:hypothetical protein